jgi:hypothetical protein
VKLVKVMLKKKKQIIVKPGLIEKSFSRLSSGLSETDFGRQFSDITVAEEPAPKQEMSDYHVERIIA